MIAGVTMCTQTRGGTRKLALLAMLLCACSDRSAESSVRPAQVLPGSRAGFTVTAVNDRNFADEVLRARTPVLAVFFAHWSMPDRAIVPFVNELAGEYQGRVKVAVVDIDESPATSQKYGIRGIPTLLMIKTGQVVAQKIGALPKAKIKELMEQAL
jgi:thioredoxin